RRDRGAGGGGVLLEPRRTREARRAPGHARARRPEPAGASLPRARPDRVRAQGRRVVVSEGADRLVDDIVAIARIPAPTFGEEARIEWIERRLLDAPGVRRRDAVGNLLWTWGSGPLELLLTAHVDTVFGADVPLAIRDDGEELHGPGIGDNATAIAMVISVVDELLREGELAAGGVAFTVAEEGLGNLRGATAAFEA